MRFYDFLENVKFGKYHFGGKNYSLTDSDKIEMANAHPFVFQPTGTGLSVPENNENIGLPFRNCFFEMLGSPLTGMVEQGQTINVSGIYVKEISPKIYEIACLLNFSSDERYSLLKIHSDYPGADKISSHMLGMVKSLLDRVSKEEIGFAKVGHKIKLKTKKGNEFVKIKKVVYVTPKREVKNLLSSVKQEIDWSHQWTVRGHWRNITGKIGKDRDGNPMADYTWINNYIKGPEHAPLVNKVRVVRDQSLVQD